MNRIVIPSILILALALVLTPGVALGASAWTGVVVNQTQDGWSPNHQLDFNQNASISASTTLGNQANISASSSGAQGLWVTGRGHQEQDLAVGTRLQWADNTWPATAVGTSHASLDQSQVGWSNSPMSFREHGGVWLRNGINGVNSNADATVAQSNLGAVGDASQSQSVAAQGRVQGFVDPPLPPCHWCTTTTSFGGRLVQRVNVLVENVLNF